MKRHHGFTLLETVALLFVIALIIAIVLPMLVDRPRRRAAGMHATMHVRGIHSGMVLFAQGCKDAYPGFNSNREPATDSIIARPDAYGTESTDGTSTVYRMAYLLRGNFFSPEYAISPAEIDPDIVPAVPGQNMLPGQNYSYAMLNISNLTAGRNHEWRATNNASAPILSDRNIADGVTTDRQSIHTDPDEGWRGSVVYNDNHGVFEITDILKTEYDNQGLITRDSLFADTEITDKGIPTADAAMVFKDNVSYIKQTAK